MKYGVRYTKQEKDSVKMIKCIFGENIFVDWGIIVFTYGDNFYTDSQITFDDWCREQTGDIKSLFEEVQYRCVIFDNKSVNIELQNRQRSTLSTLINRVKERNVGRYKIDGSAGALKIIDTYDTFFRSKQRRPSEELIEFEKKIKTDWTVCSLSAPEEYKTSLENEVKEMKKHRCTFI
ncbi:unnamed protein product [Lymnaea stagnalis]|uniref:AIG1-type G domain-containing protein n=1 Tax=Lymnaea stagnalis TaxID=6523 RepID=A0AAV2IJF0_LYMST